MIDAQSLGSGGTGCQPVAVGNLPAAPASFGTRSSRTSTRPFSSGKSALSKGIKQKIIGPYAPSHLISNSIKHFPISPILSAGKNSSSQTVKNSQNIGKLPKTSLETTQKNPPVLCINQSLTKWWLWSQPPDLN
jgi:hypothetical protein